MKLSISQSIASKPGQKLEKPLDGREEGAMYFRGEHGVAVHTRWTTIWPSKACKLRREIG